MKIIYFADKVHLQKYGRLICGDAYVAMKDGPVPSGVYDILKSVRGDGYSPCEIEAKNSFEVSAKTRVVPLKDADMDVFSDSDLECLSEATRKYGGMSFRKLKELSHDKAFKSTGPNNLIDIYDIVKTLPNREELTEYLEKSTVSYHPR